MAEAETDLVERIAALLDSETQDASVRAALATLIAEGLSAIASGEPHLIKAWAEKIKRDRVARVLTALKTFADGDFQNLMARKALQADLEAIRLRLDEQPETKFDL